MLCCLCLLEGHNIISVFEDKGKKLNIGEIISKHFWFKKDDILSSYICTICWGKIYDFHAFYETVEKSYNDFKNVHKDLAIIKKEDDYLNTNIIKEEIEEEYINVDRKLQLGIEVDCDESNTINNPLAEKELLYGGTEDKSSEDDISCSTTQTKPTKNKKMEKKLRNVSKELKSKKLKCRRHNDNANMKSENDFKPKRKNAILNHLYPLHTEEMIKKHIPMGCNLCVFVGKTFADIVAHFKAEHPNIRAYITCCNKTLTKQSYVAQHAMTHENPNCFSCEPCNKSFTTISGLQKHNLKYHAPDEELRFTCELCPKKFARQHLLQLHKPSHIPRDEWDFFCKKCPTSKAFASAYLLNIHDIKSHKREKNICNVCAKEIKDKKCFEKHVKEHYEGSGPKLKCNFPNCDSWLKDEDNLKLHFRCHKTDVESYKCPLCDKICPNRRALSSHKVYVHPKEVFKCEQCDKTFKRAISLREHITQHTGEVLYSCPFCTKTFNSNANMHSHKKKQHPVEWEALRRQKMGNNPNETVDIKQLQ